MISYLRKHFIPNKNNDHRPHILRDRGTRSVIGIIIFLEVFTFLIPTLTNINTSGNMAAVLPAVLSDLTNQERQSQNLGTLSVSPILNKAAEMKARDMAEKSYFAHTSPEGKTPWYWLKEAGYDYQYAGENLAINFTDSKDVTVAWLNSPTHKANIVKGNYTEIGTGIAVGIYQGQQTTFVAQVYANPLPVSSFKNKAQKILSKSPVLPIAVNKPAAQVAPTPTSVLGVENVPNKSTVDSVSISLAEKPTLFEKSFASPRDTTNKILSIIFGIVALALGLYLFVKIKNHEKDLVTNALVMLAIIVAILAANYYISHRNMVTTGSIDYSDQSTNF